jgi:hypothetical protein
MDVRSSNAISYLAELLKRMVYLKITRKLKIHKMQLQQMTDIWTAIPKNFRLRLKFLSPRAKYTNRTGQDLKLIHRRRRPLPSMDMVATILHHSRYRRPVTGSHNQPSDLTTRFPTSLFSLSGHVS